MPDLDSLWESAATWMSFAQQLASCGHPSCRQEAKDYMSVGRQDRSPRQVCEIIGRSAAVKKIAAVAASSAPPLLEEAGQLFVALTRPLTEADLMVRRAGGDVQSLRFSHQVRRAELHRRWSWRGFEM